MFLVATEDEISENAACKLIREAFGSGIVLQPVRRNGYGYLKSSMRRFAEAARTRPVLVLTDLDRASCAPRFRQVWLDEPYPDELFFRVAVRESEAWLLADREAISQFLHVRPQRIDRDTETIGDPKRYLLELAKGSPRELRNDLLPRRGARSIQGFGYSRRLIAFIENHWSPERASAHNASLRRAMERLHAFRDKRSAAELIGN